MRLSDYVINFIKEEYKVDTIFTVSGGGCIFLIDSLSKTKGLKYVCNHHEQACAIAAEGYARKTNNIGVCLVTSGPGGTNTITGVLGAWLDSTPILVLSGQVNRELTTNYTNQPLRQLGDQEFNIVDSVKNITKYSVQVNDPNNIRYHLEKALFEAKSGRPGPVWLDIPLDVQKAEIDPSILKGYSPPNNIVKVDNGEIQVILKKLKQAKKPLLILGNGVRLSGGLEELNNFLISTNIPVITSTNGNDIVNNDYEYYCGRFGTHAQIAANNLLNECDFLLSIGSRLYVRQIGYNFKGFAKNAYKVVVDIDNDELNKPTISPDLKINSDAKIFLNKLNDNPLDKCNLEWKTYCKLKFTNTPRILDRHRNKTNTVSHYRFIEKLNEYLPEDYDIVTSDGSAHVVTMQVLDLKGKQRLITNKGNAPMGHGLPCVIGAACVKNSKWVCIEGDGSLHLNVHELQTLKHYNLPVKLILFNNNGYSSIKLSQEAFFNGNKVASDPSSGVSFPNWKKLIDAYDLPYYNIKNHRGIDKVLEEIFKLDGPVVVEVETDPNEAHEPKVMAQLDKNNNFIPGELHNIKWIK
jgi:acetolactate synthase-1/2/3 large subunit|tara:strand:+ start:2524 stop:4260 length:1737 start_codon:yes stop_codon:yes gene_type:complete